MAFIQTEKIKEMTQGFTPTQMRTVQTERTYLGKLIAIAKVRREEGVLPTQIRIRIGLGYLRV